MYKTIVITILSISFFTSRQAFSTPNFELYNNLSCPIYYLLSTEKTKPIEHNFIELQSHTYIQQELESIKNISLIVVQNMPVAGQELPVYTITPKEQSHCIYIKTHVKKNSALTIIPQAPLFNNPLTTQGQLPLTGNIGHHEIWLSKTTYQQPHKVETKEAQVPSEPQKEEPKEIQVSTIAETQALDTLATQTNSTSIPEQQTPATNRGLQHTDVQIVSEQLTTTSVSLTPGKE